MNRLSGSGEQTSAILELLLDLLVGFQRTSAYVIAVDILYRRLPRTERRKLQNSPKFHRYTKAHGDWMMSDEVDAILTEDWRHD